MNVTICLTKILKSLLKTAKLQNNYDSQVTLKTCKSKLLDSQVPTDYQVTHWMLKPSKSKTSKLPKDYQVDKITNFEANSMTHKSSKIKTLKSSKSKDIKINDFQIVLRLSSQ